jgi:hypothetical protein
MVHLYEKPLAVSEIDDPAPTMQTRFLQTRSDWFEQAASSGWRLFHLTRSYWCILHPPPT